MEAATPLRQPRVTVQNDRVLIDGLVIADECLTRLVAEAADPDALASDALTIGARVLDREQTGANAEFVKTEYEKLSKTVEAGFGERAKAVSDELARSFDEYFSDGSSVAVQHRIREVVADAMKASREDILKLFAADSPGNPLMTAIREVRAADERQRESIRRLGLQVQELRDEKQKLEELAEERERGTAKGRSYEELVGEAVDAIAAMQGDTAEAVGDDHGAGGKKGDVLVGLDGCAGPEKGRVVFEAKNSRLSKPEFNSQLADTMEQRNAGYAVLVVPSAAKIPAKMHSLREYQGDKIIAVFDPEDGSTLELEYAYRVARLRVLAAGEGADDIDAAALRTIVQRAQDAMSDVRKVRNGLTNAEKGIGAARAAVDSVEDAVRAELAELDRVLGQQQLVV